MLRPTKHSHPDRTVIAASVVLLKRLRTRRVETFDSLRTSAFTRTRSSSGRLFAPALNLLFLLGLIEYRPKTDSFEYVGE